MTLRREPSTLQPRLNGIGGISLISCLALGALVSLTVPPELTVIRHTLLADQLGEPRTAGLLDHLSRLERAVVSEFKHLQFDQPQTDIVMDKVLDTTDKTRGSKLKGSGRVEVIKASQQANRSTKEAPYGHFVVLRDSFRSNDGDPKGYARSFSRRADELLRSRLLVKGLPIAFTLTIENSGETFRFEQNEKEGVVATGDVLVFFTEIGALKSGNGGPCTPEDVAGFLVSTDDKYKKVANSDEDYYGGNYRFIAFTAYVHPGPEGTVLSVLLHVRNYTNAPKTSYQVLVTPLLRAL